ncbi:S-methyl-5-thioribose-1-phosphate isomerase [Methanospirillum hungatei]|uniref:S-methyl-5-thioribose-1-phosphate isomerase n=1 Tax=Methanospirillum hungatei TaxID=2203 RepID=UPI00350E3D2D
MEPLRPILFHPHIPSIEYIEQTLLPDTFEVRTARTIPDLAEAIKRLGIRGAPALGCAGACGVALSALITKADSLPEFLVRVESDADLLRKTRPTAVNLFYGIDHALTAIRSSHTIEEAKSRAVDAAQEVIDADRRTCHAIGKTGLEIIPEGARILTHCNAGALACAEWGTALGVIRSAHEAGKNISVYACETRPLLQGARLTTWELLRDGIDVTLITDSMAAVLMRKGAIDVVVVGADRIVSDAVFNKIGTYMHAVCAHAHSLPFYIAAPLSTFDEESCEDSVIIEERDPQEVRKVRGCMTGPDNVPVWNPAFDATPVDLISGIITEYGIFSLPRDIDTIKQLKKGKDMQKIR